MDPIKTILVPIDFDPPSEAAIDAAIRLAKNLGGASVTLLHVEPFKLTDVPRELFYEGPNASDRAQSAALAKLAQMAQARHEAGVPIQVELRQGIVWDEILGAARRLSADMIVLGTHARSGLQRGILGSVSEQVVRSATVPVLTVRVPNP